MEDSSQIQNTVVMVYLCMRWGMRVVLLCLLPWFFFAGRRSGCFPLLWSNQSARERSVAQQNARAQNQHRRGRPSHQVERKNSLPVQMNSEKEACMRKNDMKRAKIRAWEAS